MFFILTLASLVLTSFTNGKTACDKYPGISLAIRGHCFFEPPDDNYMDQFNVRLDDTSHNEVFVLAKARDLCRKHCNSTILRYDMRNTNNDSIAKALREYMVSKMRFKSPVVDCYTESKDHNPIDLDCTRQSEPFDGGRNQSMLFIIHRIDFGVKNYQSNGLHEGEHYWSGMMRYGLLCHQPPCSAQCPDPPTTIPTTIPTTSASATLNVPNFMAAITALAWLKEFNKM